MVGVSRVRHRSWPCWRAPPHRAVALSLAARNGLAQPHRRCTRFAQEPAESAEVEARDVARSAAWQTVKSHELSRRPGRRVHPNWARCRGSKQALHSLVPLVLLFVARGFRLARRVATSCEGMLPGKTASRWLISLARAAREGFDQGPADPAEACHSGLPVAAPSALGSSARSTAAAAAAAADTVAASGPSRRCLRQASQRVWAWLLLGLLLAPARAGCGGFASGATQGSSGPK